MSFLNALKAALAALAARFKKPQPAPPPAPPPAKPPVIPTPPPPIKTPPAPVNSATATKLAMTTQPSSTATSGTALSRQPVVQLQDAGSNPVAQSGVSVVAAIGTGTGTLSGTTTQTTSGAGAATFTDLAITGASTDTITFTSTGLTSVTSSSITVSSGGSFADPNIAWNDWANSATGSGNGGVGQGALVSSRQFGTDTPGHCWVISNPTGSTPWVKSSSTKVVQLNFDIVGGSDMNYTLLNDPHGDWGVTLSYGDTVYISWWFYISVAALNPGAGDTFRKLLYLIWNANDPTKQGSPVIGEYNKTPSGQGIQGQNQIGGGILIPHDPVGTVTGQTWHYIEVQVTMDSAPGAGDGSLTVWFDDESAPLIGPTTTGYTASNYPSSPSVYFMNILRIGQQLENATVSEFRYLGPCGVSTARMGKL